MLTDWIHWFSSLNLEIKIAMLIVVLMVDFPRYLISNLVFGMWDWCCNLCQCLCGKKSEPAFTYCPSVCVVLPGYNEAATIGATLASLCGSYPRLEIIMIDDGSLDNTSEVVRNFARTHPEVRLLRREERGGKASAMNWAHHYTNADVLLGVDGDCHLGPNAIWEIVQPLKDPSVGAVSGAMQSRNPFVNLVTRFQAQEYLRSIFLGRRLAARLGILGIISGAFGAFRRSVVHQLGGWNVGPGEDADITTGIRKCGYEIAFAPDAQCYTNTPTTFRALFKQRLRWDRSIIRGKLRQHVDTLNPFSQHFRITNFWITFECLFFCVICLYGLWGYLTYQFVRAAFFGDGMGWQVLLACGLCYLAFYPVQVALVLFYSHNRARDFWIMFPIWPFVTFYQLFLCTARLVAVTGELLYRKSYDDNFYPIRCREATWRW